MCNFRLPENRLNKNYTQLKALNIHETLINTQECDITSWIYTYNHRLLDRLVVECWLRVREAPGSIPSQGPRHTKDVITMVPVVSFLALNI